MNQEASTKLRFDALHLSGALLSEVLNEQEIEDVKTVAWQTKHLQREFLDYFINEDNKLYYIDYEYVLIPQTDQSKLFNAQLQRNWLNKEFELFTGLVEAHNKPYEIMYRVKIHFIDGKMVGIRRMRDIVV